MPLTPTSTPTSTSSTATGTTATVTAATPAGPPPDPRREFIELIQGPQRTFDSALSAPLTELEQLNTIVGAEQAETPRFELGAEAQPLTARRYRDLPNISFLLGEALAQSPGVVAATGVTPQLVQEVAARDSAATNLAVVSTQISEGASDGAILAGVTSLTLCGQVLAQVQRRMSDPSTPPEERSVLSVCFNEPLKRFAEFKSAAAEIESANRQATAAQDQARLSADQQAADNRLASGYLTSLRPRT